MLFNIPQFIDKEDKIVGILTAKQLGWLFGGGALLMVLWTMLDTAALIIVAIPVVAIFAGFAFYHPNGMTLLGFVGASTRFFFHPKIYIWRRIPEKEVKKKIEHKKVEIIKVQKEISSDKIEELSKVLDRK
jgi:hypothetical protein